MTNGIYGISLNGLKKRYYFHCYVEKRDKTLKKDKTQNDISSAQRQNKKQKHKHPHNQSWYSLVSNQWRETNAGGKTTRI